MDSKRVILKIRSENDVLFSPFEFQFPVRTKGKLLMNQVEQRKTLSSDSHDWKLSDGRHLDPHKRLCEQGIDDGSELILSPRRGSQPCDDLLTFESISGPSANPSITPSNSSPIPSSNPPSEAISGSRAWTVDSFLRQTASLVWPSSSNSNPNPPNPNSSVSNLMGLDLTMTPLGEVTSEPVTTPGVPAMIYLVNSIRINVDGKLLNSNTKNISIQPLIQVFNLQPSIVRNLQVAVKKCSNGLAFPDSESRAIGDQKQDVLFRLTGDSFLDYDQEYILEIRCDPHPLLIGSPPRCPRTFKTAPLMPLIPTNSQHQTPALNRTPNTSTDLLTSDVESEIPRPPLLTPPTPSTPPAPPPPPFRLISYADVRLWTNNFDPSTDNVDDSATGLLGEGSYGKVFKGLATHMTFQQVLDRLNPRDPMTDIPVQRIAVKQLRLNVSKSIDVEQLRQAMVRELAVLSDLRFQHPNVVKLLGLVSNPALVDKAISPTFHHEAELDEMDIYPCLVYEYLPRGSLETHLKQDVKAQRLTWMRRLKIVQGVARGLNHLHTARPDAPVCHRDIKPANIGLDVDFTAKLIDYGLARYHPLDGGGVHSLNGEVMGSKAYLCPSYLASGNYNALCDIYSFGIVLLEVLSGRTQDVKYAQDECLHQHVPETAIIGDNQYADSRCGKWPPSVVVNWKRIALRCLKASPTERYLTMQQVVNELVKLNTHVPPEAVDAEAEAMVLEQRLHLAQLNRDVLLRARAMQLIHRDLDQRSTHMRQCGMTTCVHRIVSWQEGISCPIFSTHFCCRACLATYVQNMLLKDGDFLRRNDFQLFCPVCLLKEPMQLHAYTQRSIAQHLDEATYNQWMQRRDEWIRIHQSAPDVQTRQRHSRSIS